MTAIVLFTLLFFEINLHIFRVHIKMKVIGITKTLNSFFNNTENIIKNKINKEN